MAVKADGTLWAWGYDNYGAFGAGTLKYTVTTPLQIGTAQWSMVKTSGSHTLGIKKDGTLWFWGYNSVGQLGTGTNGGYNATPAQIGTATDWASINAGSGHMTALKDDQALWLWGQGWKGPLGNGSIGDNPTPTRLGVDTWLFAAGGNQFTLAVKSSGTLWAWGANHTGQLGQGTAVSNSYIPTPQQVGSDTDWAGTSTGGQAGGSSAMKAITDAGWGWSGYPGTGTEWYETPQLVMLP